MGCQKCDDWRSSIHGHDAVTQEAWGGAGLGSDSLSQPRARSVPCVTPSAPPHGFTERRLCMSVCQAQSWGPTFCAPASPGL